MGKTLDQEIGRADMAGIARLVGWDMAIRLWGRSDAGSDGVTAGTIARRVLEYPIHVALFAA